MNPYNDKTQKIYYILCAINACSKIAEAFRCHDDGSIPLDSDEINQLATGRYVGELIEAIQYLSTYAQMEVEGLQETLRKQQNS